MLTGRCSPSHWPCRLLGTFEVPDQQDRQAIQAALQCILSEFWARLTVYRPSPSHLADSMDKSSRFRLCIYKQYHQNFRLDLKRSYGSQPKESGLADPSYGYEDGWEHVPPELQSTALEFPSVLLDRLRQLGYGVQQDHEVGVTKNIWLSLGSISMSGHMDPAHTAAISCTNSKLSAALGPCFSGSLHPAVFGLTERARHTSSENGGYWLTTGWGAAGVDSPVLQGQRTGNSGGTAWTQVCSEAWGASISLDGNV